MQELQERVFDSLIASQAGGLEAIEMDSQGGFASPDLSTEGLPVFTVFGLMLDESLVRCDPIEVSNGQDFHYAVLAHQLHTLKNPPMYRFGAACKGNLMRHVEVDSESFTHALREMGVRSLVGRKVSESTAADAVEVTLLTVDEPTGTFEFKCYKVAKDYDATSVAMDHMGHVGGGKSFGGLFRGRHMPCANFATLYRFVQRFMDDDDEPAA